jgi:DNA primase
MGADDAGEKATAEIMTISLAPKRVQAPTGKDINEFYRLASEQAVREWLKTQL